MLPSNWFSLKYKSCIIPGYLYSEAFKQENNKFHSHVFDKHIILSGLQSAIKMIHLIILVAVGKG